MTKEKVLLAAPNSYLKNYCFKEWITLAKSFGCDVFIADNSLKDKNRHLYKQHKVKYKWINPVGKNSMQYITESQEVIRKEFMAGDYTHLFFLETDLFPPKSILPLFLAMDLPVVTAPYYIYKGKETTYMNQQIKIVGGEAYTRNFSLLESFIHMDGTVKDAYSTGFGCTLIKREVMEQIKTFRWVGDTFVKNNIFGAHADSFFYADLQRLEIPCYWYTGITVRHYNSDWSKILRQISKK